MSENSMVLKEATPMTTPSGGALGLSTSGVNILSPRPLAPNQPAPVVRAIALTPARLVNSFVHRWPLAVLVGLILAAGGAAIAWATYKPKYVAVAMLRMESNDLPLLHQTANFGNHRDEEFRRSQTVNIRNRDLLARVLSTPSIGGLKSVRSEEDPLTWFEKELNATIVPGTNVMRVTLSGESPLDLEAILKALVAEYVKRFNVSSHYKLSKDTQKVEELLKDTTRNLKDEKENLKNAAANLGNSKAMMLVQENKAKSAGLWEQKATSIEIELIEADAKRTANKALRETLRTQPIPSEELVQALEQHPEIQNQLRAIAEIDAEKKNRRLFVKDSDPVLKQIEQKRVAAIEKLAKSKTEFTPECEAKVRIEAMKRLDASDQQINRRIEELALLKKSYLDKADSYMQKTEKLGVDASNVDEYQKAVNFLEAKLSKLIAEKDRIQLEMNYARDDRISLFQDITPPTINQNSLVKSTAGFSIAGFFLGVLGICFLDARGQRVFKPVDVQRELGIETLGSFPRVIPNSKRIYGRKKEEAEHEFKQFISESSNRLCATLLCGDRLPQKPVLMVTSACANEGKTTVAAQLVRGFGRAGKKSLLVDCDVRNSRCHQMFGIPAGPGLSEVLRGEATLAEAVRPAASGQFSILTAGSSSGSLLQALSDGTFANILNQLREEYDSIVIDTAPTLLVSEGLLIGKMVDGVLLVVRSKVSKAPEVMAVYEQLTSVKIPVYGAIVNEYEPATYKQSYYRGND